MYKFSLQNCYNVLLVALVASFSLSDRIAPLVFILLAVVSVALRLKLKIPFSLNTTGVLFSAIYLYYLFRLLGTNEITDGIKFLEKNLSFIIVPLVIIPSLICVKKKLS